MIIKARKHGNSIVLTIPKSINVPVETKFTVDQQINGDLIFKRVNQNTYDLWSDSTYDDYDAEINREYQELGYNLREMRPVGISNITY